MGDNENEQTNKELQRIIPITAREIKARKENRTNEKRANQKHYRKSF